MSPKTHGGGGASSTDTDPLKESRYNPPPQQTSIGLWSPTALGPVSPAHSSRSPGMLSAYPQLGGCFVAQKKKKQFPSIFEAHAANQTAEPEGAENFLHPVESAVPVTNRTSNSSKCSADQPPPPPLVLLHPDHSYAWTNRHPSDAPLGSGYTATVYRGVDVSTGSPIAIKVVPKEKQRLLATDGYYRQLYRLLPKQSHPSILRIRDFLEDANNFFIISDLCSGSDLVDYVLNFSPRTTPLEEVRSIVRQILVGVHNLHSRGIIHRDLKLDNILFTDAKRKQVNIVDFDMSLMVDVPDPPKPSRRADEVSVVGTKDYMAPEAYKGIYSEASDLWSVGVILYILLDGHFPFDLADASSGKDIRELLRHGVSISSQVVNRGPLAADLLSRLLEFDFNLRIKTAWDALRHPWFSCKLPRSPGAGAAGWNKSSDKENVKAKTGHAKEEKNQQQFQPVANGSNPAAPIKVSPELATYEVPNSSATQSHVINSSRISANVVPTTHSTTIKPHKCPAVSSLPSGTPDMSNTAATVPVRSRVLGFPNTGKTSQLAAYESTVACAVVPPKDTDYVIPPSQSACLSTPNKVTSCDANSGCVGGAPANAAAAPCQRLEQGGDGVVTSRRDAKEGKVLVKDRSGEKRKCYATISSDGSTLASLHERGAPTTARLTSRLPPEESKFNEKSSMFLWSDSPVSNSGSTASYRYNLIDMSDRGERQDEDNKGRTSSMTQSTVKQDKPPNLALSPPYAERKALPLEYPGHFPVQMEKARKTPALQKKAVISSHRTRANPPKGRQSVAPHRSSQLSPAPTTTTNTVLSRSLGARPLEQILKQTAAAQIDVSQQRLSPERSSRGMQRKATNSRYRPPKENARSGVQTSVTSSPINDNLMQTPRRKAFMEDNGGKKHNGNDIAQRTGAVDKRKISSPALLAKRTSPFDQRGV